ncbi:hypothetical protein BEWA_000700 [Theileria equi strain WA]|uniref:Uncharacterized protein n=1 Tax=Theileria equi strain WA TaxID=1537102 RepID=L0AYM3_THEEQ|nr:hypothetical protein BEWA_000700 [Theileria equi strain WA]AFZ80665.1 hypothetical protein BEWA_000700 [Theileria equi strain WA]|eukprot:XP_004830331.1 hypothetical protein BEWA_000700 [Theileria equi strain WA]
MTKHSNHKDMLWEGFDYEKVFAILGEKNAQLRDVYMEYLESTNEIYRDSLSPLLDSMKEYRSGLQSLSNSHKKKHGKTSLEALVTIIDGIISKHVKTVSPLKIILEDSKEFIKILYEEIAVKTPHMLQNYKTKIDNLSITDIILNLARIVIQIEESIENIIKNVNRYENDVKTTIDGICKIMKELKSLEDDIKVFHDRIYNILHASEYEKDYECSLEKNDTESKVALEKLYSLLDSVLLEIEDLLEEGRAPTVKSPKEGDSVRIPADNFINSIGNYYSLIKKIREEARNEYLKSLSGIKTLDEFLREDSEAYRRSDMADLLYNDVRNSQKLYQGLILSIEKLLKDVEISIMRMYESKRKVSSSKSDPEKLRYEIFKCQKMYKETLKELKSANKASTKSEIDELKAKTQEIYKAQESYRDAVNLLKYGNYDDNRANFIVFSSAATNLNLVGKDYDNVKASLDDRTKERKSYERALDKFYIFLLDYIAVFNATMASVDNVIAFLEKAARTWARECMRSFTRSEPEKQMHVVVTHVHDYKMEQSISTESEYHENNDTAENEWEFNLRWVNGTVNGELRSEISKDINTKNTLVESLRYSQVPEIFRNNTKDIIEKTRVLMKLATRLVNTQSSYTARSQTAIKILTIFFSLKSLSSQAEVALKLLESNSKIPRELKITILTTRNLLKVNPSLKIIPDIITSVTALLTSMSDPNGYINEVIEDFMEIQEAVSVLMVNGYHIDPISSLPKGESGGKVRKDEGNPPKDLIKADRRRNNTLKDKIQYACIFYLKTLNDGFVEFIPVFLESIQKHQDSMRFPLSSTRLLQTRDVVDGLLIAVEICKGSFDKAGAILDLVIEIPLWKIIEDLEAILVGINTRNETMDLLMTDIVPENLYSKTCQVDIDPPMEIIPKESIITIQDEVESPRHTDRSNISVSSPKECKHSDNSLESIIETLKSLKNIPSLTSIGAACMHIKRANIILTCLGDMVKKAEEERVEKKGEYQKIFEKIRGLNGAVIQKIQSRYKRNIERAIETYRINKGNGTAIVKLTRALDETEETKENELVEAIRNGGSKIWNEILEFDSEEAVPDSPKNYRAESLLKGLNGIIISAMADVSQVDVNEDEDKYEHDSEDISHYIESLEKMNQTEKMFQLQTEVERTFECLTSSSIRIPLNALLQVFLTDIVGVIEKLDEKLDNMESEIDRIENAMDILTDNLLADNEEYKSARDDYKRKKKNSTSGIQDATRRYSGLIDKAKKDWDNAKRELQEATLSAVTSTVGNAKVKHFSAKNKYENEVNMLHTITCSFENEMSEARQEYENVIEKAIKPLKGTLEIILSNLYKASKVLLDNLKFLNSGNIKGEKEMLSHSEEWKHGIRLAIRTFITRSIELVQSLKDELNYKCLEDDSQCDSTALMEHPPIIIEIDQMKNYRHHGSDFWNFKYLGSISVKYRAGMFFKDPPNGYETFEHRPELGLDFFVSHIQYRGEKQDIDLPEDSLHSISVYYWSSHEDTRPLMLRVNTSTDSIYYVNNGDRNWKNENVNKNNILKTLNMMNHKHNGIFTIYLDMSTRYGYGDSTAVNVQRVNFTRKDVILEAKYSQNELKNYSAYIHTAVGSSRLTNSESESTTHEPLKEVTEEINDAKNPPKIILGNLCHKRGEFYGLEGLREKQFTSLTVYYKRGDVKLKRPLLLIFTNQNDGGECKYLYYEHVGNYQWVEVEDTKNMKETLDRISKSFRMSKARRTIISVMFFITLTGLIVGITLMAYKIDWIISKWHKWTR